MLCHAIGQGGLKVQSNSRHLQTRSSFCLFGGPIKKVVEIFR